MNSKLEIAQALYFSNRYSVDQGSLSEQNFNQLMISYSQYFKLTEYELREAKPEFKAFVAKNNFLVTALEKYGFTEPFEDYKYSFNRLTLHLNFSEMAFRFLYDFSTTNFEYVLEDLEISNDNEISEWEVFKNRLSLSSKNIVFEQSLISLLTIFETYITNILQWIFQNDEEARYNIKVMIKL